MDAGAGRGAGPAPTREVEVAILALPRASLSGVYALHDDFRAIGRYPGALPPACRFRPRILTLSGAPEPGVTGAVVHPHGGLDDAAEAEIVLLPPLLDDGRPEGVGAGAPARLGAWLRARHAEGAVVAGLCTGAFPMAEAGLLDGREATTHWLFEPDFRRRFPAVRLISRGTLVATGPGARLITGGASVYPTEVSLQIIAAYAGVAAAQQFAHLFGRWWRADLEGVDGGPAPEVDDAAVALACAWIERRLETAGLVRGAAAAAMLTERTLNRRFRRALGLSPAEWVAKRRIERARALLETTRLPVEEVAARVGYAEAAAFRRAFRRAAGLAPGEYRRRFKTPAGPGIRALAP